MSRLRVAERVAHGGHNIPEADLIRRFPRSLHNLLNVFAPKVNQAQCYMNNDAIPELVFQQEGAIRTIFHPDFFVLLQQKAQS
jgi:predicted ABC-type ATPase